MSTNRLHSLCSRIFEYLPTIVEIQQRWKKKKLIMILDRVFDNGLSSELFLVKYQYGVDNILDYLRWLREFK